MSSVKKTGAKKIGASSFRLLPGEELAFKELEFPPPVSDEDLNVRYVRGEGRIVTESARYNLAGILAMLREEVSAPNGTKERRYKLDPEYQRRHRWNDARKSRLIESFLMNVPVPPIFLYERDYSRFEVMDGKQRLTTLSEFYENKFALVGLQHWPQLNGRKYSQLPEKVRDGIDRRYLSAIILLKETAPDEEQAARLKKIVFERLNSGGVELSPQESRNAVYEGPLSDLCLLLSQNPKFCAMWRIPPKEAAAPLDEEQLDSQEQDQEDEDAEGRRMYEKMDDVELVLRFFAYRQIDKYPGGLNKINAFLDRFLGEGNKTFKQPLIDTYRKLFEDTVELLYSILGEDAFCRLDSSGAPKGRPVRILYDPLMFVASCYAHGKERKILEQNPGNLRAALGSMYESNKQSHGGRSTNTSQMRQRNELMQTAFRDALKRSGA